MIYGLSETARLFNVDRDTIKTWSYTFSDYLSLEANPGKEKIRPSSAINYFKDKTRLVNIVILDVL